MKARPNSLPSVLAVLLGLPALGGPAQAGGVWVDVTNGGTVSGLPQPGNWPGPEAPPNAVDDNYYSKYLNFDKLNTGFTVNATNSSAPVTRAIFATANDVPERDPASYALEGSNDGGANWTPISSGVLSLPTGRNNSISNSGLNYQSITFANATAFQVYRLVFPTVRDAAAANSMQIGEVSLLAQYDPGQDILDLQSYVASAVGGSFPGPEGPDSAIDNNPDTKYLNFGKEGTGMRLVTTNGDYSVVTGLTLGQANDAPARDVTAFTLRGSANGVDFFDIVTNMSLNADMGVFEGNTVAFSNSTPYRDYEFIVTGLRSAANANSFQFSELQLHGTLVPEPAGGLLALLGLCGIARRRR